VILKSRTLSRTSDTTETRNPCVIKVILLTCFTYIDIFKFIKSLLTYWQEFFFYAEVNFWDFVRNDNSNKGTTALLNETRFGPKKKSSPIYLGPKNLDTFWWNCQIIFRCASIHGRAGFILDSTIKKNLAPLTVFDSFSHLFLSCQYLFTLRKYRVLSLVSN
jgi:hypothetical protein